MSSQTTTRKRKAGSSQKSSSASKKRKSGPRKNEAQQYEEKMDTNRKRMAKVPSSELNNDAILAYVSEMDPPFVIRTHPLSKRQKSMTSKEELAESLPAGQLLHTDGHESRLTLVYEVSPPNVWEHIRRYKKFTIGDPDRGTQASIEPGEYILVKNDDTPEESNLDRDKQWKAQVLEVRALDSEHVFVRVAWLNRPVDLEKGDPKYYGKMELIPTNQLDIIDAMTVNGKTQVVKWDEADDDSDAPSDQYFWRQVYDQAGTKTFIPSLRKVCVCFEPINPDETLVQCAAEECAAWLHSGCIAKDAHKSRHRQLILETDLPPELEYTREELDRTATNFCRDNDASSSTHVYIRGPDQDHQSVAIYSNGDKREARPVLCLSCAAEFR